MLHPLRSLSFQRQKKKIRARKGRFQKGSFSHQKKKNVSKEKRPRKGKYRGQNARANTLLSINKTPNYTSSPTRYRDFRVLVLLSAFFLLALLYISQRRLRMMTRRRRRREEARATERERERIFSSSLDAFCLLFVSFLHPRDIFIRAKIFFSFSNTEERQKTLVSPLPFFCPVQVSLSRALELFFENKKIQKNEKRASRERENQNHCFTPQQPLRYIPLSSARDDGNDEYHHQQQERRRRKGRGRGGQKAHEKRRVRRGRVGTQNTSRLPTRNLGEEVYVQDLGKVSDDVKVVEAEKRSWNRKPLARPIDGQTDSIRTF